MIKIAKYIRGEIPRIAMIDSETETLIESKNVRLLLIRDVAKIPVNITVRDEIINGMGL
jgi:hypothetical protein|tara:strand:- start:32 stop:208 length:177 start_codon:yes stop_codon:yes gene_type:complete